MSEYPDDILTASDMACDLCGITKYSDLRIFARQAASVAIFAERERDWQSMETAPRDARILAVVDGEVRTVRYGKTSHVPLYGFCLADQGPEDFDLCKPTAWMPLPSPPKPSSEPTP